MAFWVSFTQLFLTALILILVPNCTQADTMYYGFFFDEVTAATIKASAESYFKSLQSNISEIDSFLKNISSAAGIENPLDYYTKPKDPNTGGDDPYYHVTAKYCGTDQEACAEYTNRVEKFINATFQVELIGYVLTNRTFGVRINLVGDQVDLFDMEGGKGTSSLPSASQSEDYPGIIIEPVKDFPPQLPVTNTSRAHITLGCAPGIPAVTTGPDMLLANALETNQTEFEELKSWDNVSDPLWEIVEEKMIVNGYQLNENITENVYVIYPRVKILANATFTNYDYPPGSGGASSSLNLLNVWVATTPLVFTVLG